MRAMNGDSRFEVERRLEPDRVVLGLGGELDLSAAPQLAAEIARAESDPVRHILVLDVDGLTFVDSSGLRVILAAHERALAEPQRAFAITSGSRQVKRLLEIAGVEEHLVTLADPSAPLSQVPGDAA
jgi:anti-sigma B factor antagonist